MATTGAALGLDRPRRRDLGSRCFLQRTIVESVQVCHSDLRPPFSSMSKSFESSRAAEPVGAFPHAKRVGDSSFFPGSDPVCAEARKSLE